MMQSIRQIQRLNDAELEKCVAPNASWHTDYRDTAYIYIGGLPFELSEGDVLTIFSQYGNPVHINLVRDKETGKSRGFAFLKYEDQRSCDLAVDNLSGAGVLGRVLTVDHTRYKLKDGEVEGQGLEEDTQGEDADETDQEGDKRRKRRRTSSAQEQQRPMIKEELELAKLLKEHDDDDPMKAYLVKEKKEQIADVLKNLSFYDGKKLERKHKHHHSRRHKDDADEINRHHHRRRSRDRSQHESGGARSRGDEHDLASHRSRNGPEHSRIYRSSSNGSRSASSDSEVGRRRRRHQDTRESAHRRKSRDRDRAGRNASVDSRERQRMDEYRRR